MTGYDRSNGDNCYVIIPYDDFILFLDDNFVCKTCKKNKNMVYERQTCGIATSRYFNFWCHLYWHKTEEKFKWRSNAVIEHHFNNHRWCDPAWCVILNTELVEKEKVHCKYRSKLVPFAFYKQAKKALSAYTTREAFKDLQHGWHSNKCESLYGFITKAIPKNKHTCLLNLNKARTNVIVGIDSLGYALSAFF
jgi:hypothetical protein